MTLDHVEHVEQSQTPAEGHEFDIEAFQVHNPKLFTAIFQAGQADLVSLLKVVLPEDTMSRLGSLLESGVTAAQARAMGFTLEASGEGADRRRILQLLEKGLEVNANLGQAMPGVTGPHGKQESPLVANAKIRATEDAKRQAQAS
ncbi:hypothetical protein [Desulfonatronum thiodismutans]|uniref:hypothetical protein n=1 Tax=Desulfonatronum thiodismutans TaxID=159290 RepID=UPI0004ABEB1D|nr:hypothetical protein [Desulfonatronum thiodismutans]